MILSSLGLCIFLQTSSVCYTISLRPTILGEAELHLHADNCSGQNKNRFVMQYLAWRVLVGFNDRITLSFLVVGHIKFSPDWCFGLFKQAYRRAEIGCLEDIVKVVEFCSCKSCTATVNREYFDVKIFSDSMACAKIKRTKYMRNINEDAVQGRLSENYLTRKIIA